MITKFLLVLSLLCSTLILMSPSIGSSEEKILRAAYSNWFPYTYLKEDNPVGFEIDMFKAIMEDIGVKVNFSMLPWVRCLNYLEKGKTDIVISMLNTPERRKFAYFPDENISISKSTIIAKKNANFVFNGSCKELSGLSIGIILGFSYGNCFDQAHYLQKDGAVDTKMLIRKLLRGRNDIAVENPAVGQATALKMGVSDQLYFVPKPLHVDKLFVGFSKASDLQALCTDFSKLLYRFKKTKQCQMIIKKYGIKFSDVMDSSI